MSSLAHNVHCSYLQDLESQPLAQSLESQLEVKNLDSQLLILSLEPKPIAQSIKSQHLQTKLLNHSPSSSSGHLHKFSLFSVIAFNMFTPQVQWLPMFSYSTPGLSLFLTSHFPATCHVGLSPSNAVSCLVQQHSVLESYCTTDWQKVQSRKKQVESLPHMCQPLPARLPIN